ncbi:hypothetical protein GRI89_09870, partial [Altererythrobacter salegens]
MAAITLSAISVAVVTGGIVKPEYIGFDDGGDAYEPTFGAALSGRESSIDLRNSALNDLPGSSPTGGESLGEAETFPLKSEVVSSKSPFERGEVKRSHGGGVADGALSHPSPSEVGDQIVAEFAVGEASQRIASASIDPAPILKSSDDSYLEVDAYSAFNFSASELSLEADSDVGGTVHYDARGSNKAASRQAGTEGVGARLIASFLPALKNLPVSKLATNDGFHFSVGEAPQFPGSFGVTGLEVESSRQSQQEVVPPSAGFAGNLEIDTTGVAAGPVASAGNADLVKHATDRGLGPLSDEGRLEISSDEEARAQLVSNGAEA